MQKTKFNRPPLASLACVNEFCDLYGRKDQGNLIIRKVYGKAADQIPEMPLLPTGI